MGSKDTPVVSFLKFLLFAWLAQRNFCHSEKDKKELQFQPESIFKLVGHTIFAGKSDPSDETCTKSQANHIKGICV